MVTWAGFSEAAPETAAVFLRRLEATGLALMATVRADGSPRISPIEPLAHDGDLWLGSMPGSRKSDDLRRDPRLCLHSATEDKNLKDGDAKLWGRAVLVTDDESRRRYASAFRDETGMDPEELPGGFDLFTVDITAGSAVELGADGQHLRITAWEAGGQERVIQRH